MAAAYTRQHHVSHWQRQPLANTSSQLTAEWRQPAGSQLAASSVNHTHMQNLGGKQIPSLRNTTETTETGTSSSFVSNKEAGGEDGEMKWWTDGCRRRYEIDSSPGCLLPFSLSSSICTLSRLSVCVCVWTCRGVYVDVWRAGKDTHRYIPSSASLWWSLPLALSSLWFISLFPFSLSLQLTSPSLPSLCSQLIELLCFSPSPLLSSSLRSQSCSICFVNFLWHRKQSKINSELKRRQAHVVHYVQNIINLSCLPASLSHCVRLCFLCWCSREAGSAPGETAVPGQLMGREGDDGKKGRQCEGAGGGCSLVVMGTRRVEGGLQCKAASVPWAHHPGF